MRIALCQINPVVGDLAGNVELILDFARRAAEGGAELAVFPELCVTAYPPLDLLENAAFIHDVSVAVDEIARQAPPGLGLLVGAPVREGAGKPLRNAAILLEDGRRIATTYKVLLPSYDVFDEARYFAPGPSCEPVVFRGKRLGVLVCEDMWNAGGAAGDRYGRDPVDELTRHWVDLLVDISASPFALGKHQERTAVIEAIYRRSRVPLVFVNQVGANTELIFDGDSRVHGSDGTLLACAPSFEESLLIWDGGEDDQCSLRHESIEDLHDALVLGIRDYFRKTGAFTKALVGLSGGIDSAVTCALAVEALGRERVVGVTMPSRFSSEGSVEDSRLLAENLGIEFLRIPIEPAVSAFEGMLAEPFAETERDVTEENIQARARGVVLMALSNKFEYLLLSTGNKSEMAVGYATLYGDMSGGLAVLSDVFKQQVYRLAEFMNERAGHDVIPRDTITKPPSAELKPGQLDQDTLPPYDVLDVILKLYIEEMRDARTIVHLTGFDDALVQRVLRMVDVSEYKRRQAAPGLRVSNKAFGVGRRMPIVMRRTAIQRSPIEEARQSIDYGLP